MKPSLCGLYELCNAFYRWQFGCEAFALRSVQGFAWYFLGGSLHRVDAGKKKLLTTGKKIRLTPTLHTGKKT